MNSKLGNESSEAEYQRYGQEIQELMEELEQELPSELFRSSFSLGIWTKDQEQGATWYNKRRL